MRCVHEAQLHDENCFVTLTYNDKYLPKNGSLLKRDMELFFKRVRKHYLHPPKFSSKEEKNLWYQAYGIRYYYCGEYGEKHERPHYHVCFFNFSFPDAKYWKTENGNKHYRSETLENLWSHGDDRDPIGHALIGPLTYHSAAYAARYVMKKITGKKAPDHYQGRLPEYTEMSNRPGIAKNWYEKYKNTDVFPRDYIELNGFKHKVPKYYSRNYELTNPEEYGKLRLDRQERAKKHSTDDPALLRAAEKLQQAYDKQLKRNYEKSTTGDNQCLKSYNSSQYAIPKPGRSLNRSPHTIKLKPFARFKARSTTPNPLSVNTLETFPSGISVNMMIQMESLLPNRPPNQ